MSKKSLLARKNELANTKRQLDILSNGLFATGELPTFAKKNSRNKSVPITLKKIRNSTN